MRHYDLNHKATFKL